MLASNLSVAKKIKELSELQALAGLNGSGFMMAVRTSITYYLTISVRTSIKYYLTQAVRTSMKHYLTMAARQV